MENQNNNQRVIRGATLAIISPPKLRFWKDVSRNTKFFAKFPALLKKQFSSHKIVSRGFQFGIQTL